MSRVILANFPGGQYGVRDLMVDQLYHALEKAGHVVSLIDATSEGAYSAALHTRPDLVIAFNIIPLFDDVDPHDALDVPLLQLLLDHPLHLSGYATRVMERTIHNRRVACVDRTHVAELSHFFGPDKRGFFLPHAGLHLPPITLAAAPRPLDVVFLGSYQEPKASWTHLPPDLAGLTQELVDRALSQTAAPFFPLLESALRDRGITYNDSWRQGAHHVFSAWDPYIRFTRRRNLLQTLDRANLTVHIRGSGWEALPTNHTILPSLALTEAMADLRSAKIALNIGPNFADGGHERAFTAMLAGALVVTDRNPFWTQHFTDDEIILYDPTDLDSVSERLRSLLDDPERRRAIASAGQAKAFALHTYDQRIRSLV